MQHFQLLERHAELLPDREQPIMTAVSIESISPIQGIRLRTAMYIGAMQHRVGLEHLCDAYVNGMHLIEGGTIVTGLQHGLTSAIRKHARDHDLSADETLTAEHCLTGLLSVISVRLERPHFEGPTRNRISNPELAEFTSRTIAKGLTTYFSEHPQTADMICRAAVSRSQNR